MQEGIVRAKLAKILSGYSDVHYERSVATEENIKAVCNIAIYLIFGTCHFSARTWNIIANHFLKFKDRLLQLFLFLFIVS